VLISDNKKNIYVTKIIKFYEDNISENSDKFSNYVNQSNTKMKDYMYTSYDYLINNKYKIKINQKTLERIKNYFR
jgi:peptidyl-prolyl cis-trans isomerase D